MICTERAAKAHISDFLKTPSFSTGNDLGAEGLYYYNSRWYDATLGRFITEDPIKDGNNWFSYANQNPLRFTDPTGLKATADDQEEQNKSDEAERRQQQQQEYWEARQTAEEAKQKAERDNRKFNRENPIDQIENIDEEYAVYNNGKTVSCQTASVGNIHAANNEDGIKQKDLDQVSQQENTGVNPDGSLQSISTLSENLARATNSDTAYSLVWKKESEGGGFIKQTPSEFSQSGYTSGIGKFTRQLPNGTTAIHFQAMVKIPGKSVGQANIDSLDGQRDAASMYSLAEIYPLKEVTVNYNDEAFNR